MRAEARRQTTPRDRLAAAELWSRPAWIMAAQPVDFRCRINGPTAGGAAPGGLMIGIVAATSLLRFFNNIIMRA